MITLLHLWQGHTNKLK